jgi:hypothetical protein
MRESDWGRAGGRPHSPLVRLHPSARWSAIQASCCDHGFRPSRLVRHVAVSPVRGFCIATSVAQPVNTHAVTISIRYCNGLASPPNRLLMRLTAHGFRPPPWSRLAVHDCCAASLVRASAGRPWAPPPARIVPLGRARHPPGQRGPRRGAPTPAFRLPCVSVAPTADRWVASPQHPVGSTSPRPGPGRARPCRRSGWPGPAPA